MGEVEREKGGQREEKHKIRFIYATLDAWGKHRRTVSALTCTTLLPRSMSSSTAGYELQRETCSSELLPLSSWDGGRYDVECVVDGDRVALGVKKSSGLPCLGLGERGG